MNSTEIQTVKPDLNGDIAPAAINLDEAARFIKLLTGSGESVVTFQTFADKARAGTDDVDKYRGRDAARKGFALERILQGTLAEHASTLARLNEQGAGIFLTINETDLKGRKEANVTRVRAIFADFDDAGVDPIAAIRALPLSPHIVVESSPGKAHAYWLVSDCPLSDFKSTQQELAKILQSDRAVNDLPRVMRLPGFIHQKGEPAMVKITDVTDDFSYTLAQVRGALMPARQVANAARVSKDRQTDRRGRSPANLEKIKSALAAVPAIAWDDRGIWLEVGMALHHEGAKTGTQDALYDLWCEHSRASKKFNESDSRKTWDAFSSSKRNGRTIASLYRKAQAYGWQIPPSTSRFTVEEDGVYSHPINNNGDPLPPFRICGPLTIAAEATDHRGGAWSLVLEFEDRDGRPQAWVMPMEMLAGDTVEIRQELLARGLWIAPGKTAREELAYFLQSAKDLPRACHTETPGWYDTVYVTPARTLGARDQDVFYHGAVQAHLKQSGTPEEWRDRVCSAAAGNSRLVFCVSAAFAAPLLYITGVDSGGFHFGGDSSQGKTSIVRVAASVWGGRDYVQTWRATANGLEGVAQLHNDGLLVLDEMGQVAPKEAGEAAYMLANGRGKARAGRTGGARPITQWRLLYLSTGELGLAAHMNKAGQQAEAGQEIRLIEIPADAGRGLGIYEVLNGRADGAALSSELTTAARMYHGAAGIRFLERLTADFSRTENEVMALYRDYTALLRPEGAEGQAVRAAARFALVAAAGELATRIGLTGWPEGSALDAATVCFKAWLEYRGGAGNAERRAILHQVRKFFEQHGQSRFQEWGYAGDRVPNRAGFRRRQGDMTTYSVMHETFKDEVCRGKDHRSAAKMLVSAGWLEPDRAGHSSQSLHVPGHGQVRCFVFTPRVLEADI